MVVMAPMKSLVDLTLILKLSRTIVLGVPNAKSETTSINSDRKTVGEWGPFEKEERFPPSRPFMVSLFKGDRLFCGGTLIKRDWVLTAAHCFPNEHTHVIVGAYSLTKKEEGKHKANITKTFSYPGFNPKTFENDIMLLKLHTKKNVDHTTVPLPETTDDIKAGTQCLIAGWGTISQRKGFDQLREANVTVIERDLCADKKHYNSQPPLKMSMVCAGDKKTRKDICWGDSGGPLICDGEQRGIIAFVKNCGDPRYPGVYIRLTKDYLSWIKTITKNEGREIEFRLKTRVFLGAHSWIKKERKQQRFKIVQVLSHPDYDKVTSKNDIMLLKLQGSAKIGRYVNTLELSSTTSSKDVKAGTQCLVAGWGDTYNGQEKPTKKLQEVNVTIIERRICNDKKHYNSRPYVTTDMVCAGDLKGGKDSCGGDSGGPLICNGEQRGIVSSGGPLCGDPRYPGIYTRLTKAYLTWIKRHTGDDTD
ncbi:mite allergen Der p 3-like [Elgaria multicarinata webbii]|uniref:mite allergen Der p 3-like n=1 Tax=Elgaria multicarinata webbii TaxID=159646 RepID=UPI002FCCBD4A